MRIRMILVLTVAGLASACGGGGQTEATEQEQALTNDLQPAAPSPGTVVPSGDGNQAGGEGGNGQ